MVRLGSIQEDIIAHLRENDNRCCFWVGMNTYNTTLAGYFIEQIQESLNRLESRGIVSVDINGFVTLEKLRGK